MKEQDKLLDDILCHYGVLGMRWGVRKDKYRSRSQRKKNKSSNSDGRNDSHADVKVSSIKKSRKQKSREQKRRHEEEAKTARQRKERASSAINSGSATKVYEIRSNLSNRQLSDALSKIDMERKLTTLYRDENPTRLQRLERTMNKVKRVNNSVNTAIDAYNTFARLTNKKQIGQQSKKPKKIKRGE